MKRMLGAVLALAGGVALFFFVSRGMHHGRSFLGAEYDPSVPFRALGRDYPTDGFLLLGALWGFILGTWFIVTGDEGASKALQGGKSARLFMLNGLLLLSSLFVGYVGGRGGADPRAVAIFGVLALGQGVLGLILLLLALTERPKGFVSLAVGSVVWLGGTAAGVMVFMWGGA
ncbi:MAG TPA: hypothetical protein VF950_00895 [Planctomycetota bacterium]